MSYVFDESALSQEIRKRGAKRVLLQFPEGLRYFSTELVQKLSSSLPDVEFLISGEPSWGACDVAEDEANLLRVDLLVHFGHSPYTWYYPKFPTLFVRAESTLELDDETISKLKNKLEEMKVNSVALTSTVQHASLLSRIKKALTPRFKVEIGRPSSPFMNDGQVLGCDYRSAMVEADVQVNVSGGLFHALGLGLATNKPVLKLDPYTKQVEDITPQVFKIMKIRYSKIMEAMDSTTWVIVQGLKVGQNRPLMVRSLESKLKSMGKKTFVVTSKVLNQDALRNLDRSYIDVFVVTSCPRLPTDDLYSYEKPVLTPGEAKMIITNKLEPYIFPW
ncbi:diphthamide biosynthesis enzyme Dph2 [Metallosphaera cuprina]|uniref:2-(3-amino-3-carboxypropyl)histidine synthase n=1 Tax=Metallosphaera cuprina (strain Ar-4) TaxID=1006006 RepID=F4G028_METCR|nr:diphthamide biosynthesis enzyme Dph2 [Metallosphaera cuprina]AEB94527.1 diphthamide biosynthesis protein [Metallosphaera cuprina Ar-4]